MTSLAFALPVHVPQQRHWPRSPSSCVQRRIVLCASSSALAKSSRPTTSRALIEQFWSFMRAGQFSSTASLFSPTARYFDTLYPSPFEGLPAISAHLSDMETAMPRALVFVLDDLAPAQSSVGARWHAETPDGRHVPFTRGASMYKVEVADDDLGGVWITEAWDFPETPLKVAGVVLPVLKAASFLLNLVKREEEEE